VNPCWRLFMAANYKERGSGTAPRSDDRQREPDERPVRRAAYVNLAHARGRPLASSAETRGRPV
jgi:hypothetical protein